MPDEKDKRITAYLASIGRRGGESTSDSKVEAGRANAAKARAAKEMYRKYPILRRKEK